MLRVSLDRTRNDPGSEEISHKSVAMVSRWNTREIRGSRRSMRSVEGLNGFREVGPVDDRSYGVRTSAMAGSKVASMVLYIYRAVRKPALRNERSPIGLLACPLRSFISIFLLVPLSPVLAGCPSLYPSLSATRRSSFLANLRRDSQLEVIATRACQIRIGLVSVGPWPGPIDPHKSTIRSPLQDLTPAKAPPVQTVARFSYILYRLASR